MTSLLPFVMFAFVASITPGPSNILVLSSSAHFGFLAALPVVGGSCVGSAALVLLVGFGIGEWLKTHPDVQMAMNWAGAIWLTFLAWQIASKPIELSQSASAKHVGYLTAATIQVVNPKTWAMALAVITVFSGKDADLSAYALLSGTFLLVSLPCLTAWAAVGSAAGSLLSSRVTFRMLNIVLGLMLVVSTWTGVLEHIR